jgi:hypothetical protein
VHAAAFSPKQLLVVGALLGIRKTKKINIVPCAQISKFLERTNSFTFIGWVWNAVR